MSVCEKCGKDGCHYYEMRGRRVGACRSGCGKFDSAE